MSRSFASRTVIVIPDVIGNTTAVRCRGWARLLVGRELLEIRTPGPAIPHFDASPELNYALSSAEARGLAPTSSPHCGGY
jgi:hypothetical protein